jgi:hypothetical protein
LETFVPSFRAPIPSEVDDERMMAYDDKVKNPEVLELVEVTPGDEAKKLGTEYDQRGMARMGRKQELRRQFEFFSITGYAVILGCSWEFAMM